MSVWEVLVIQTQDVRTLQAPSLALAVMDTLEMAPHALVYISQLLYFVCKVYAHYGKEI